MLAIGRALTPITSRITPPTPVFAPPNGSSAEGWLWVSTLNARSKRSSNAMMPALSTNAERTHGLFTRSVAARMNVLSSESIVRRLPGITAPSGPISS